MSACVQASMYACVHSETISRVWEECEHLLHHLLARINNTDAHLIMDESKVSALIPRKQWNNTSRFERHFHVMININCHHTAVDHAVLVSTHKSATFKHLVSNPQCLQLYDDSCFSVVCYKK